MSGPEGGPAPAGAHLDAVVRVRRPPFELDVALRVGGDEVVAVLGPNGAGKSTLLGAVAGLVPLDGGRVCLGGAVVDDPAAGVHVPAERRRVGIAFQDGRLFPHLTAAGNVAFGLRARGVERADADRRARQWLERLGVGHRADARPGALSGGEARRVALARALAGDPQLVLLDEPLSGVDHADRAELRRLLAGHLASAPGVRLVVTHDPVEAHAMADRILVVEGGRLVQEGSPAEVAARPRTAWVAAVAGVNLLRGRVVAGSGAGHLLVDLEGGGRLVAAAGGAGSVAGFGAGPVLAVVHPHAVALHRQRPEGTPRNVWLTTVTGVETVTDRRRVRLAGPPDLVAEVTAAAAHDLAVAAGQRLWASVKATEVDAFPA